MNPEASPEVKEKLGKYPKTDDYEVWDTIGVPHPFTSGSTLVAYAADKYMGRLGKEAIRGFEKERGRRACAHPRCNLMYDEHETAVVIKCKKEDNESLQKYCQDIVKTVEEDGYAGFVFLKAW